MVVVGKQLWYETYIVQALKNDNITVFTPVLFAAKTWQQKTEL